MTERSNETSRTASGGRSRWAEWAAYAACGWALVFAAVHLYWVLGGTLGLPSGWSVVENIPLLISAVISIPLCLVAAMLALALVEPRGQRMPRWMLLIATWGACALFALHSASAVVEWVMLAHGLDRVSTTSPERCDLFLYEPWFLLGGILFGVAAWHYTRGSRSRRRGEG